MCRVLTKGKGYLHSISGRVITKSLKIVLDSALF